jgi:predicted DCC family thiol-disulfide oxidoreductase YuxK
VGRADAAALEGIEAGGRRFVGAAAVNRVLRELGGWWWAVGVLYLVPGIGWLEDRYYKRVARRRRWW